MKICYCLPEISYAGGIGRITITEANWMSQSGNDVILITTDQRGDKARYAVDKHIRHIDLGINYLDLREAGIFKKMLLRLMKKLQHRRKLSALLNELRPDIVVSALQGEESFLYKIKDGSRKVGKFHYAHDYRIIAHPSGVRGLIARYLTKQMRRDVSKLDAFAVLTAEDAEKWRGIGTELRVIPNFTDFAVNAGSHASKKMVSVGRLSHQKNFSSMIRVWEKVVQRHPDWKLEIYGTGEEEEALRRQISERGLSANVELCGLTDNIAGIFSDASAFLSTSIFEGFPMVFAEAISCGLPIISFDYPSGPKEVIGQDECGIIVKNGDEEGMAEAVCRFIEDPGMRERMSLEAIVRANRFRPDSVMVKWLELFKDLS